MTQLKSKLIVLLTLVFLSTFLVCSAVFADTDKTALINYQDAVHQAVLDNGASYETNSYSAFEDALALMGGENAIETLVLDDLTLQVDIDNMVSQCQSLLDGLVTTTTYNGTLLNYLQEKTRVLTIYTDRSKILFNAELARIKSILDEPTSGEVKISALNVDISNASSLLIPLGDLTEVNNLYLQAESIMIDHSAYIPSTFEAFDDEYQSINASLLSTIGYTKEEIIVFDDASIGEVSATVEAIEQALSMLVLKPDKSSLISLYNIASNLDLSSYTSNSRNLFVSGLTPILVVINDEEAISSDISNTILELNQLSDLLVLKGDKTTLLENIDSLDTFDFSIYTPTSVTIFNQEIARITLEMNDENTDELVMAQLETDFENAFALMVLKADKNQLEIANNQSIIAYYEERTSYTNSSYQAFKSEVFLYGTYLYVNTVFADQNVSQADVDLLTNKINHALGLLELLIDNSDLLLAYQQVSTQTYTNFTPQSVTIFQVELDRIYDIITGNELSQSVYDQLFVDIESAPSLLVLRADKTDLVAAINSYSNINSEDYTSSSYAYFIEMIDLATTINSDDNVTQQEVDDAVLLLTNAHSSLIRLPGTITIKVGSDPFDVKAYITFGTATVLSYVSSDESVLVIDELGNVSGVAFGEADVVITLSNNVVETIHFLVKAKVSTLALTLSISIPVTSVALALAFMYWRPGKFAFVKKIFQLVRRKKA